MTKIFGMTIFIRNESYVSCVTIMLLIFSQENGLVLFCDTYNSISTNIQECSFQIGRLGILTNKRISKKTLVRCFIGNNSFHRQNVVGVISRILGS